jgi:hypothetical protein
MKYHEPMAYLPKFGSSSDHHFIKHTSISIVLLFIIATNLQGLL